MSIFDTTLDRRTTNCCKWNKEAIENISANPEALPFWVADMDFPSESHIKAKAESIFRLGAFGYPIFSSFNEIAASWLEKKAFLAR